MSSINKIVLNNSEYDIGGGSLPVEVEILETICEDVVLTGSTITYTLPSAITINTNAWYYLDYESYNSSNQIVETYTDYSLSKPIDNNNIRWFGNNIYQIILNNTTITDKRRQSSYTTHISIYKVKIKVIDGLSKLALNQEGCSNNQASGLYAHAEGEGTIATNVYSHAEGWQTQATGIYGHAEGDRAIASNSACHAEGTTTIASGLWSHAEGCSTITSGSAAHSQNYYTKANNFASTAIGQWNKDMTTGGSGSAAVGDAFVIGNGSSNRSNAFRVTFSGATYGLSSFHSSGADYAEYFEWLDKNPYNEDRIGYFVTLDNDKIRKANEGDYVLGIVSGQPCIIGNGDEDWLGRYKHDEFDRFIIQDVEVPITEIKEVEEPMFDEEGKIIRLMTTEIQKSENPDEEDVIVEVPVLDETGLPVYQTHTVIREVPTGETRKVPQYVENPDYDPSQPYIERKDRKEWSAIGMVGVLAVRDDGTCQVNSFCKVMDGGIATAANSEFIMENGNITKTYRVIKRVSDNIIKVILK